MLYDTARQKCQIKIKSKSTEVSAVFLNGTSAIDTLTYNFDVLTLKLNQGAQVTWLYPERIVANV
jgi:hypothetical protein